MNRSVVPACTTCGYELAEESACPRCAVDPVLARDRERRVARRPVRGANGSLVTTLLWALLPAAVGIWPATQTWRALHGQRVTWDSRYQTGPRLLGPTEGIVVYGSMTVLFEGWAAAMVVLGVWQRVLERKAG